MVSPAIDVSVGYSLAASGSNSAWAAAQQFRDVTPPTTEVDDIDTGHQGTLTANTHQAADINENGELQMTHHYVADDQPVVGATNETFTLTHPDAETLIFCGYISSSAPNGHVWNGKMMATTTFKVSGDFGSSCP